MFNCFVFSICINSKTANELMPLELSAFSYLLDTVSFLFVLEDEVAQFLIVNWLFEWFYGRSLGQEVYEQCSFLIRDEEDRQVHALLSKILIITGKFVFSTY